MNPTQSPPPQPSQPTPRRVGRPRKEIPLVILDEMFLLRHAGQTIDQIVATIQAKHGKQFSRSTLYRTILEVDAVTSDGREISRFQALFGLPRSYWRRFLRKQQTLSEERRNMIEAYPPPPGNGGKVTPMIAREFLQAAEGVTQFLGRFESVLERIHVDLQNPSAVDHAAVEAVRVGLLKSSGELLETVSLGRRHFEKLSNDFQASIAGNVEPGK